MIFINQQSMWQVYCCNNRDVTELEIKNTLDKPLEKFDKTQYDIENLNELDIYSDIYIIDNELYQVGRKVTNSRGYIQSHLYQIRKIGILKKGNEL